MTPQTSSTELSKVESDIVQTVGLTGTIITLIREPIALIYKNATKDKKLKRSLGFWKGEALKTVQCRIPVLRLDKFEEHLVQMYGAAPAASSPGSKQSPNHEYSRLKFPPDGSACWAYFLFALGIWPGMGVAAWRPVTDGFINTQDGGIEMEFEGSVLCHIINLFSVTLDQDPFLQWPRPLPNRRRERRCKFPFGDLAWTTTGDELHAHFKPGLEDDLISAKQPFGSKGTLIDSEKIMALYLTALFNGVSDSDYQLAKRNKALAERITRVTTCFHMLGQRNYRDETLLISYDWFEEAARVKRRVLAQGGQDHSFFEDICKAVDNDPRISSYYDPTRLIKSIKHGVRKLFLLDDETFTFSVPGLSETSESAGPGRTTWKPSPWEDFTPMLFLEATLLRYNHQPAGSWRRGLFDMKKKVLEIAAISNDFVIESHSRLQLIEFTTRCELWDKKVFLGAPTCA